MTYNEQYSRMTYRDRKEIFDALENLAKKSTEVLTKTDVIRRAVRKYLEIKETEQ